MHALLASFCLPVACAPPMTLSPTSIDQATDTSISGALVAKFDSDDDVDGTFTITICPDEP